MVGQDVNKNCNCEIYVEFLQEMKTRLPIISIYSLTGTSPRTGNHFVKGSSALPHLIILALFK
jgi:hypothetical protein